ncbi:hypothetical protein [Sphingobium yanoikuyae]|uniref:hypothetical protein n=1 Tax=Sphingobium yanoikuyae TaxID=13690 RepID=UPI00345E0B61
MKIVPAHVWNPDPVRAGVQATVISGGTALDGDETVIQTDGGGRVEISYGEFDLDDPYARRLWDAWQDYFSGGARVVAVPVLALELAPVPAGTSATIGVDDQWFPTSVSFSPPMIIAETVGLAPLRAVTITLDISQGDAPEPGTWFGIGYRAYKIRRVISVSGSQYEVEFSPPLRDAVADATPVNMDWPVVQCRPVLGQDLIPQISNGQYGSMSVSFVEDFTPLSEVVE